MPKFRVNLSLDVRFNMTGDTWFDIEAESEEEAEDRAELLCRELEHSFGMGCGGTTCELADILGKDGFEVDDPANYEVDSPDSISIDIDYIEPVKDKGEDSD